MKQYHVTLLSFHGHQARKFDAIRNMLPPSVVARHLNVHYRMPESLLQWYRPDSALAPEQVEDITRVYFLQRRCRDIRCDSLPWRLRLTLRANQWHHLWLRKLKYTDLLVVWNGFAIPLRAAVLAARELGITVLHGENGVLPGTMALDPAGINFHNSLAGKSPAFYDAITPDPARVEALFATPLQQRPLRATNPVRQLTTTGKPRTSSTAGDDGKPLPERYVLFAMQVHDDSQLLLFSPRFRDMPEAVTYTAKQVARYNARTGDTLRLVVKEHPSDFGRIDYGDLRRALPEVIFLRATPISEIIDDARAVITVNSAVGVEGLLHLRPVITLGDAFYNVPGVVRHLGRDELEPVLAEVVDQPVNRDRITRFLHFLRYDYLLPISPRATRAEAYQPAAERIVDALAGKLWWAEGEDSGGRGTGRISPFHPELH